MITNDATLLKVKHEVLYEVAKLAYEGRLDDERDNLPYKMVPGPQPFFRCCIYREREVIRQRIRLAEGKAPGTEDDGNVVQIINSACEGCPWEERASRRAVSVPSAWDVTSPTSTHQSVRSVDSVPKHVRTMPLQI